MSFIGKTALSAIAGAVLMAGASTASAAPTIRVAPVETAPVTTQVGYHGYFYGGHGYGYGYKRHCFWKKKRFWGYYGYYWKRVKVCY